MGPGTGSLPSTIAPPDHPLNSFISAEKQKYCQVIGIYMYQMGVTLADPAVSPSF